LNASDIREGKLKEYTQYFQLGDDERSCLDTKNHTGIHPLHCERPAASTLPGIPTAVMSGLLAMGVYSDVTKIE
jgi:hypothetical protein